MSARVLLPVANFNNNVASGYAPFSVQFTDMSKNVVRWNWNFGDGTDSTVQSPMHTYPAARVYTVNLTVNNGNGTNTKLATNTVPSIYGYSFNDLNGNKIMDVVDVGISNMAINLNGYDTSTSRETIISTTTRTNATGYY